MQSQAAVLPLAPGERARRELLADPTRPDKEIAALIGCSHQTVRRMRRQLMAAGPARARPPTWALQSLSVMPELAGGLCVRHPEPDLWTSRALADRTRAIRVCQRCPVQAPCRIWALSLPVSDTAVWGGMSAAQRLAIRRQLAAAGT
jgi:Transcription factor WhiB